MMKPPLKQVLKKAKKEEKKHIPSVEEIKKEDQEFGSQAKSLGKMLSVFFPKKKVARK